LSPHEVQQLLAGLPDGRMPTVADWRRLSVPKRHRLDERIAELETRCDKPHPVQRLRLPVTAHLRAL